MNIGGAVKRFAYTAAGGGLGTVQGLGRAIGDLPKIGKNVAKFTSNEIKDVWKSDANNVVKGAKTAVSGTAGLVLTGLCVASNTVANIGFGFLAGMGTGLALSDKGGKVHFSKDQCVSTTSEGTQAKASLERDQFGAATTFGVKFSRPSTEFIQSDTIQGDNVQIHGDKSGKGLLVMIDSNTQDMQVNGWGRSVIYDGPGR